MLLLAKPDSANEPFNWANSALIVSCDVPATAIGASNSLFGLMAFVIPATSTKSLVVFPIITFGADTVTTASGVASIILAFKSMLRDAAKFTLPVKRTPYSDSKANSLKPPAAMRSAANLATPLAAGCTSSPTANVFGTNVPDCAISTYHNWPGALPGLPVFTSATLPGYGEEIKPKPVVVPRVKRTSKPLAKPPGEVALNVESSNIPSRATTVTSPPLLATTVGVIWLTLRTSSTADVPDTLISEPAFATTNPFLASMVTWPPS